MSLVSRFFFLNDTAPTEIYTLSLHDALPISPPGARLSADHGAGCPQGHAAAAVRGEGAGQGPERPDHPQDRKSTRLNSSHRQISYAVFCLQKKTDSDHRCRTVKVL